MAISPFLISQFVAAAAMLLLAGWLLWLNPKSTVNRAFALFLFFRAGVLLTNRFKALAEDAGREDLADFWHAIRNYYYLALAPALLYFWTAYSRIAHQIFWRVAILVGAIAIEGLYLLDHCLDTCTTSAGLTQIGPLGLMGLPGYLLVTGLVGLWFLRESLRVQKGPRAAAAYPVAVGLLATPLIEAGITVGLFARFGAPAILGNYAGRIVPELFHGLIILAVVPAIAGIIILARATHANPGLSNQLKVLVGVCLLGILSGFLVGWEAVLGVNWLPGIFLLGLWRILLPAVVVYALVKHRLFGLEVRIRWALVRATVAFTFLAAFFVTAELAQNYFSNEFGWSLGGLVAGLLLFAISPLQRMAERFTQVVMPNAKPIEAMAHPDRLALFRQQAALVWSDGTMGRKERAILDDLRTRLKIPFEAAARMEAEAAKFSAMTLS